MKALKKAEDNQVNARELREPDNQFKFTSSERASPAPKTSSPPFNLRGPLLAKTAMLALLLLGVAGIWWFLKPAPQAPVYLRQPVLQSSAEVPSEMPQPIAAAPVEIEPSELVNTPAVAPSPPVTDLQALASPPAQEKVAFIPVAKPRRPSTPAAAPIITPVDPGVAGAYAALQRGDYSVAEGLYQTARERQPGNIDALLGSAVIAASRNQPEQALQFYTRVLELEPGNSLAQAGLIGIIGKSDFQLAETRLKALVADKPAAHLYFALGNVYANQSQWEQAQAAYFEAYHLQPTHAEYSYNLAVALDQIRLPGPALEYYLKALSLSESKPHILFDRAKLNRRIAELKNIAP